MGIIFVSDQPHWRHPLMHATRVYAQPGLLDLWCLCYTRPSRKPNTPRREVDP